MAHRSVGSVRPVRALLAAAWVVGTAVGGSGIAGTPPEDASLAPAMAGVRMVHLSPDAPLVDLVIDGVLRVRDLPFVGRSEVILLPPGRHELRVFPHRPPQPRLTAQPEHEGAGPAPRRRAVPLEPVVSVIELPAGTLTTVALMGSYTPLADEDRRGHLSLQVSPADAEVVLEGPHGFATTVQGDQFLVGLQPGPYQAVAQHPGYQTATYEVDVTVDTTSLVTITLQELDPADAEDARDAPADGIEAVQQVRREAAWRGLELQPYRDERVPLAPPGLALVRFIHVAPTVPPIEVDARVAPVANGEAGANGDTGADGDGGEEPAELLAADLSYPNAGRYQVLPALPLDLEVRVAGTRSVLLEVAGLELAPGVTYTVFVSADPLTNTVWLVPVVDAAVPQWRPEAQP